MDGRPYGPRPAPRADKREAAYESIFGRPSVNHHHPPPPGPSTSQAHYPRPPPPPPPYLNYPPSHAPYQAPYPPQQHYPYAQADPRSSYQPSLGPMHVSPNQTPRQSQQYMANPMQPYYGQPPPSSFRPNSLAPSLAPLNRVRSISDYSSQGMVDPPPDEPPDITLESLVQRGMTPAQAYQAQVYLNSPQGRQNGWQPPTLMPTPNIQSNYALQRGPSNGGVYAMPATNAAASGSDLGEFGAGDGSDVYTTASSEDLFSNGDRTPPSASSATSLAYTNKSTPHQRRPSVDSIATSVAYSGYSVPHAQAPSAQENAQGYLSSPGTPQSPVEPSSPSTPRRSSESARTMPSVGQRTRSFNPNDRTRSFSSTHPFPSASPSYHPLPPIPTMSSIHPRSSPRPTRQPRQPQVPPALLSRVAQAFQERIQLSERVKDGLAYPDAFDGREAVDKISYIIRTTDRNLALLLGRALDSQKFFHDVAYEHRLRDSAQELYQFQTRLSSPFVSKDEVGGQGDGAQSEPETVPHRPRLARPTSSGSGSQAGQADSTYSVTSSTSEMALPSGATTPTGGKVEAGALPASSSDEAELPTGVFTLLTDCYSPTCSRDSLCYSIACPRRLEQQSRLNMKPEAVLKSDEYEPETDPMVEPGTLWIHSVPQEIIDKVSETEKKRQEAINEVMYTERDFVRDMEYLRDVWIKPLQTSDIIEESRRADFITQVFWNVHDIIAVNIRLRDALNKRQKGYAIVERIGDILLEFVPQFCPFVAYGSHQLYGKYEFEKEKSSNPAFAKFVDEAERLPESRKLELNGYLTKPTTRLARYPLLLDVVLKYTPDDNPDKIALPKAIAIVREFLAQVNHETGKTENRFSLLQLDQQLVFRPGETVDLRLRDENRELVYKGALSRKGGTGGAAAEDLQLYLFDHALLMVKAKTVSKHEQLKVYRKPIPLELLIVIADDGLTTIKGSTARPKSSLIKGRSNSLGRNSPVQLPSSKGSSAGYSITFIHLGRKGYTLTLYANTVIQRRKWVENIHKRQEMLRDRSAIFDMVTLSEAFFIAQNKVNCAAPFGGGHKVAYGTDDGVYISDIRVLTQEPVKVLAIPDVAQVDVLEDYQLLIVLSERTVMTFPLEALDPLDPTAGLKRAKRVASHTSFFKAGLCLGRTFVCVVKASSLSSTIKVLEPIDQTVRGKNKPTFRKLLQGGNDTLKVFKEFYIPTESSSIHFLKTKLCVGCTKGFEIVDLETLDTQGLLDPADTSLDFVQKKENVRPISIYRIDGEFLLCYDEFAFFVNKAGWRSRPNWIVYWEGIPTAFALHYPYVLAFEGTFIEIRHVETGIMVQIIPGNNLRCLFADTPPTVAHSMSYSHTKFLPPLLPGQNPYGQPLPPPPYPMPPQGFNAYTMPPGAPPGLLPPPPPPPPPRPHQANGRDEIILVSDDRVFCVKLAGSNAVPGGPYQTSQVSLPLVPR